MVDSSLKDIGDEGNLNLGQSMEEAPVEENLACSLTDIFDILNEDPRSPVSFFFLFLFFCPPICFAFYIMVPSELLVIRSINPEIPFNLWPFEEITVTIDEKYVLLDEIEIEFATSCSYYCYIVLKLVSSFAQLGNYI